MKKSHGLGTRLFIASCKNKKWPISDDFGLRSEKKVYLYRSEKKVYLYRSTRRMYAAKQDRSTVPFDQGHSSGRGGGGPFRVVVVVVVVFLFYFAVARFFFSREMTPVFACGLKKLARCSIFCDMNHQRRGVSCPALRTPPAVLFFSMRYGSGATRAGGTGIR